METLKVAFLINPIAGMGGRVGLKGTDNMLEEALKRGATPIAWKRAEEFISSISNIEKMIFISPIGDMGTKVLKKFKKIQVIPIEGFPNYPYTSAEDTKRAVRLFLKYSPDIIVFVGGDGTARDIVSIVKDIPILGVPAGVKMYSSVFALTPRHAAMIVEEFLYKREVTESEVLDIDEEAFRHDRLEIKSFGYTLTPQSEFVQASKELSSSAYDKESIAEYFIDFIFDSKNLYILGPGTTVYEIKKRILGKGTILGVDIYSEEKCLFDVSERDILEALERFRYKKAFIVLTIIGGQGALFGRGNQQISSKIIEKVGIDNIIVVADSLKVRKLKRVYIDIDDEDIRASFPQYLRVLTGYGRYYLVEVMR